MDWPDHLDLEACLEQRHRQHHQGCVKAWEDLNRYEQVLDRVRPTLIVEVGTFSSKAAIWFAQHAAVLTCDPSPQIDPSTDLILGKQPHPIRIVRDRSDSRTFYDAVTEEILAHPGPMLLTLDGDHSAPTVMCELETFAPLAAYIVVEDTLLRWFPEDEQVYDGDPLDALEAWLPSHPEWTVDRDVEALHDATQMPHGWLRRVET